MDKNKKIVLGLFITYFILSIIETFFILMPYIIFYSIMILSVGIIITGFIFSTKVKNKDIDFGIAFQIVFGILLLKYILELLLAWMFFI